jgi:hypothetical protein
VPDREGFGVLIPLPQNRGQQAYRIEGRGALGSEPFIPHIAEKFASGRKIWNPLSLCS